MNRAALTFCLFLFALIGSTTLAKRVLYIPPENLREALRELKDNRFIETKDDYDFVFVGSSRVHGGINVEVFDAVMKELGCDVTSFNYGTAGYRGHEIDHRIRRDVMAKNPTKLKFLAIELMPFDDVNNRIFKVLNGTVHWHTRHQTLSSIRTVWRSDEYTSRNKINRIRSHLLHMSLNYTTLGEGVRLLGKRGHVDPSRYDYFADAISNANGYLSHDAYRQANLDTDKNHSKFLKHKDRFVARVESLKNGEAPAPGTLDTRAFRAQTEAILAAGIIPIYFTYPTLEDYSFVDDYRLQMPEVIIVRTDDPEEFAWAYQVENRHDSLHLNDPAIDKFTRILAERMAEQIAANYPDVINEIRISEAKPPSGAQASLN